MDLPLSGIDICSGIPGLKISFSQNTLFNKTGLVEVRPRFFALLRQYDQKPNMVPFNNRKMLKSLLKSLGDDVRVRDEYVNRFMDERVLHYAVRALSEKDLERLGILDKGQRDELLEKFAKAGNQNPSFQDLCKMPLAEYYNLFILSEVEQYMEAMFATISATECRLQGTLLEEVMIEQKVPASSLALEAIEELHRVIDEVLLESKDLEKAIIANAKLEETVKKKEQEMPNDSIRMNQRKPFHHQRIWMISIVFTISVLGCVFVSRKI